MSDQSQVPAESPPAAPIQEWLLAILACPSTDRSPLTYQADVNELWCTACDRAYPIRDGIPVLLVQEARHRSGDAAHLADEPQAEQGTA